MVELTSRNKGMKEGQPIELGTGAKYILAQQMVHQTSENYAKLEKLKKNSENKYSDRGLAGGACTQCLPVGNHGIGGGGWWFQVGRAGVRLGMGGDRRRESRSAPKAMKVGMAQ